MSLTNLFTINGVVDTGRTVYQNIETIASAANSWVTFDTHSGKWSLIINRPGVSTKSFNDSNVIGSINVSGTGILERYNSVRVEFPHRDVVDQRDFVIVEIPQAQRDQGEIPNELTLTYDIINDPIQAQILGLTELKQSRVDKIVQFRTDFSSLGIKAGDIIDLTTDTYDWNNKLFRIVTVEESDENNDISLSITAVEYDESIYDYSDLNRFELTRSSGIFPRKINPAVLESDDDSERTKLGRLLGFAALSELINILSTLFAPADGAQSPVAPPQANENPCGDGPFILGDTLVIPPAKDPNNLICLAPIGTITVADNGSSTPSLEGTSVKKMFIEV